MSALGQKPMPALGHKRTFAVHQRMSAFPLKADIRQRVATPLTLVARIC